MIGVLWIERISGYSQWIPILAMVVMIGQFQGCASSQTISSSPGGYISTRPSNYQPTSQDRGRNRLQQPFEGRLPLGIGTRFDLFLADAASGMSDLYNSYIEPYRRGKLFSRQPYALDYSILPRKGEAFQGRSSMIESVTIKSDYKFQIGMSRNFRGLSDFLDPNFWLARGRYCPVPSKPGTEITPNDLRLQYRTKEESHFDLNRSANDDLTQLLDERWGLAATSGQ